VTASASATIFGTAPYGLPLSGGSFSLACAAANFTVLLGGFGATNPSAVKAQLLACEAAGLGAIPSACESGPESANSTSSCVSMQSDSLWGFQMVDEPSEADFPAVKKWFDSVGERAPGKLRFINLLPNYGVDGDYHAYVQSYVDTVQPDMLWYVSSPSLSESSALHPVVSSHLRLLPSPSPSPV
jgi:hypothetical protein